MEYLPYTGNSEEQQWEYLNKIEILPLDIHSHTDVSDVMDEITKTITGLTLLVERFSHSHSSHIVIYLVAAVSHYARDLTRSSQPSIEELNNLGELIIKLVANIRWRVMFPDSLSAILGIIQQLARSNYWTEQQFSPILIDLLQRCLKFGWINDAKALSVKLAAIQALIELCKKKVIETNFSHTQIEWFQSEAVLLALNEADDEYFAKIVAEFIEILQ